MVSEPETDFSTLAFRDVLDCPCRIVPHTLVQDDGDDVVAVLDPHGVDSFVLCSLCFDSARMTEASCQKKSSYETGPSLEAQCHNRVTVMKWSNVSGLFALLLFAVLVVVRFVRFEIGTLGVILCMNFELMLKRCNANKNYVRTAAASLPQSAPPSTLSSS